MKQMFLFFLAAISVPAFAATEKFVDCGPGYVVTVGKSRDGIPTNECKKIWCVDLENGKSMGKDSTPTNGYQNTATSQLYDYYNDHIECFGKRLWCPGETPGAFNEELGIYTKGGANSTTYSGVLQGNCYKWSLQSNNCGTGEIAINDNGSWKCVKQDVANGGRTSIKARAFRRNSGIQQIKIK
jgi:hypothetical protein